MNRPGQALWRIGFRPFYLLASIFAALSIALWSAQVNGLLSRPYLSGALWHAHEMLFGYTLAVVVGFLLTAGRNWSNQPTLSGLPLAALAALWVAGRVLVLTPFGWAAAIVNCAFPLAAAASLALPFIAARNRRNYFFVALLVLMGMAQLTVHLSQLQAITLPPWIGIQGALDGVMFVMAVMAGRVVPMFTNNGVPGANATRHPAVEKLALGSLLALLAADLAQLGGGPLVALLGLCAVAHAVRWSLWQPWATWRTPMVWVLHGAYLWIVIHLLLRGAAALGIVSVSAATHALTVGAIGSLTLGMMTRTARGHTGRPLRADRLDLVCYLLVLLAALVRVGGPLALPALTPQTVLCSAALWSTAFALFAIRYGPWLARPRMDGQAG